MMMSIGCIQALQCNNNTCPVGVATQKKGLMKGLDVEDKAKRAENYHRKTIQSFSELISATGVKSPNELNRSMINRRAEEHLVLKYSDIFPDVEEGSLLTPKLESNYRNN